MKEFFLRKRMAIFLLGIDVLSVVIASYLALLTRFEFYPSRIDPLFIENVAKYIPMNIFCTIVIFSAYHLYNRLWRFAGIIDYLHVLRAGMIVVCFQVVGLWLLNWYIPRSFSLIYILYFIPMVFGTRFFLRIRRGRPEDKKLQKESHVIPVMLIGAGDGGNIIATEIQNSNYLNKKIKCIIDDDVKKRGTYLAGVPVIGGRGKILRAAIEYEVEEIIIAIPSLNARCRRELLDICKRTECKLSILPGIYQLINQDVTIEQLRKVEIEDLLGRDVIQTNMDSVMEYVKEKRVLVTGGGGSIGSELCRQIVDNEPKQLIIIDNYENTVYSLQMELKERQSEVDIVVLIATVQNKDRLHKIFKEYQPELVFHAAAHKHVPLMENSPCEAVRNNVFGTINVAREAHLCGANRMVMISTDKAVRPTNVMGATKRICEMIVQTYNKHSKTEFVAVRFGNVLGSNGSVVPLFKRQIEQGGPVTVTHPDIIRYFMTIPEAVSLVLQAGAYAKGGEIFILDMGEPVKILDLARNMIQLSGLVPDEDIKIEFTGLRPGEKLYEELLIDETNQDKTENQRIFIGHPILIEEERLKELLVELKEAADIESPHIREMVQKIVPEYVIKQ